MRISDRLRLRRSGTTLGQASRLAEKFESRHLLSAAFDVVGLTALRADANYAAVDGSSIGVAIIDTGVYSAHPDITSNFAAWYDAVTRSSGGTAQDPEGHGTHVAGTAASSNPAIGVATSARIIGIRALPADGERQPGHDTVAEALQWVIDNHTAHNIKVVNMSLGVPGVNINTPQERTDAEAARIAQLESLGVTVVTASGNSYADFASPGASVPAVYSTIQVANTWEDGGDGDDLPSASAASLSSDFWAVEYRPQADQFAATSQRSSLPNQVAAPGSTIFSAWNGDGGKLYNTISGTSMASPLVAGMVALMQDAAFTFGGVYLTPADVLSIMRTTADDIVDSSTESNARAPIVIDGSGRASLGPTQPLAETGLTYKRVNVYRAIQQVIAQVQGGTITDPPPPNSDANSKITNAIPVSTIDGTIVYEFTGNIGSDGTVDVGAKDVDLYKVTIESPGNIVVTSSALEGGTSGVMAIRLFDTNGAELTRAEGSQGSGYPALTSARLNPGTYYIGVSSLGNTGYLITSGVGAADGAGPGDFEIEIKLTNPDPNGVVQGAVPFEGLPNSYLGFIGADLGLEVGSQDVDFFEVFAPDDGVLVVDIDAASVYGSEAVDTYVRVFNDQLEEIGFNDDEGAGIIDSYLELQLEKGQRVYVAVADFWNKNFNPSDPFDRSSEGIGGFYDINLRFDNGDVDGTVLSSGVVAIGNTITGIIGDDDGSTVGAGGAKDVDFYFYEPVSDGLLDLTVESPDSSLVGSLSVWVYDSDLGDVVRLGEISGDTPHLIVEVAAGEAYYVAVTGRGNTAFNWFAIASGAGGDTGNYSLLSSIRAKSDIKNLINDSVNTGTPTPIALGQAFAASLGGDDSYIIGTTDVDVYAYSPTVSGNVVIRTSSPGDRGVDTYLRIFDAAGNQLTFNDDISSGTLESGLSIAVVAGQTYYIGVNASSASAQNYSVITGAGAVPAGTGDYVLAVIAGGKFSASQGQVLGGSAGSTGSINIGAVNTLGNPVILQQQAGATVWTGSDLQAKTGSPAILGEVVSWVDPKDGRNYAAARTTSGLGLFTNTSGADWTFRNLTGEITGAPVISGELTVFTSIDSIVSLAGTAANGDLIQYHQTGGGNSGAYAWAAINRGDDLRSQGLTVPQFSGRITSFVTSWNALNVVGLDSTGQIQAVWWHHSLNTDKWTTNNLSAQTGAPVLTGGLTVWLTAWNAINIGGADEEGKLSATWWLPEFGAEWQTTNMTDLIGGPLLQSDSVSSFVTPWGAMNIAGREADGTISVYWWEPVGNAWQIARISDVIPNSTDLVGPITGLTTAGTFTINLISTSSSGDVIRYWWSVATNVWAEENMTQTATEI
ncbi:MAG: S8 family serine peptidase [Phycisphaerales bacterium]|nr:S8 family serine peptidase [Phycisphaerales bacterium]